MEDGRPITEDLWRKHEVGRRMGA